MKTATWRCTQTQSWAPTSRQPTGRGHPRGVPHPKEPSSYCVLTSMEFLPGCSATSSWSPSWCSLLILSSLASRFRWMKFCSGTGTQHLLAVPHPSWPCLGLRPPRTGADGWGSQGCSRSSHIACGPWPAGPASRAHWCNAACSPAVNSGAAVGPGMLPAGAGTDSAGSGLLPTPAGLGSGRLGQAQGRELDSLTLVHSASGY